MSYHGTHVVVIEIPEGSWGAGGQTIDTEKISKLIGATQGPKRLAEALRTVHNHWPGLFWQLFVGLLAGHVLGIPGRPVGVGLSNPLLVLPMRLRSANHRLGKISRHDDRYV